MKFQNSFANLINNCFPTKYFNSKSYVLIQKRSILHKNVIFFLIFISFCELKKIKMTQLFRLPKQYYNDV